MSSTKNKIVLKKLKELDTIWHPESKLVFKSSKDKVVIGRYFEKEIIPLDELCLELCSKWKFKYDKTLVEEEDEDDEEEEEEVVENQEEENDDESVKESVEDESEEEEEIKEKIINNEEDDNKYTNTNYKQAYLADLTSEFSKKIYGYFDSVSQKYNQELLNLKNDMTTKDKIHAELLKEHESVKQELKNLKTKFEGIKQLFSL